MSLVQLYISNEVARDVVLALGELGNVQFRDLNSKVSSFQRTFVKEIRKLDNALRQCRFVKSQMDHAGVVIPPAWSGDDLHSPDDLVVRLNDLESKISDMRSAQDQFKERESLLIEHRLVLKHATTFFGADCEASGLGDIIAGVIDSHKVEGLERILWRSLRGNVYLTSKEVEGGVYDAKTGKKEPKSTFIVVTHGTELASRATRISEALDANVYPVTPIETTSSRLEDVNLQLTDVSLVLKTSTEALGAQLESLAGVVTPWEHRLAKEKAVYTTLNSFSYDQNRKVLIGEGWIPTSDIEQVQLTLRRVSEAANIESPSILNVMETTRTPPTFHRTNKVTGAFQAMIDVYAIASYQEINPALPTVITFPFMFAVMFGDMGHGFLLFLAALYLVINERKLKKLDLGDIFDMAYSGRYILLFMGAFAMYTGFIYNDLFSKSMSLFASGWEWPDHKEGQTVSAISVGTYKFGLDWAWHGTENNLLFTNSFKMKLSVLLGYVHMSYSYMFSLANAIFFKIPIDIWGNFVPGLIFFQGIFGYLSLAIVYKWCVDWVKEGREAPSLLNMLINMFLSPGVIDVPLYSGQKQVQVFLVVAALIAVPWLLLLKPLYLKKKLEQHNYSQVDDIEAHDVGGDGGDEDDENEEAHNFGDILIHQVIHTIEFCLNCVSHTASYLRLWALSLAHAQLSSVLWQMTLQGAFGMTGVIGVIMTVILFAMWFVLTVCVLVVMEGTSAMLHALRLHWVESMSKYYIGEGKAFEPFAFDAVPA